MSIMRGNPLRLLSLNSKSMALFGMKTLKGKGIRWQIPDQDLVQTQEINAQVVSS